MLEYRLLRNLILILIALAVPAAAYSATGDRASDANDVHRLRLYHTHTDEHLDVVYRVGDEYVPEAIDELEHFLRDHRTGTVHRIDPRSFDLLNDLTTIAGHRDQLMGKLQERYGYGKDQAERELDEFARTLQP